MITKEISIFRLICTAYIKTLPQKTPSIHTDRGRKIRGTTSNSVFPHENTLTASSNAIRCIGRTRPSLLLISERPLWEVFRRFSPLPCTIRQLSGGKGNAYFFPSLCCRRILTKFVHFVKSFVLYIVFQFAYMPISTR